MSKVVIVGAGGVGGVVAHKCAQVPSIYGHRWAAHKIKCDAIAAQIKMRHRDIRTCQIDVDDVAAQPAKKSSRIFSSMALPYQDPR